MKRIVSFLLAACMVLPFSGCAKMARSEAEMLRIAAGEAGVPEELEARLIGVIETESGALACVMTGDESQSHGYYAAEFARDGGGYRFLHVGAMWDRGADMCSFLWSGGYVFVSSNELSKTLSLKFPDGRLELVDIDSLPFIYALEGGESGFEYFFLDESGKAISY